MTDKLDTIMAMDEGLSEKRHSKDDQSKDKDSMIKEMNKSKGSPLSDDIKNEHRSSLQSISTLQALVEDTSNSELHNVVLTPKKIDELPKEVHIPANFSHDNIDEDSPRNSSIIRLQAVLNEVSSSREATPPTRKVHHLKKKTDDISLKVPTLSDSVEIQTDKSPENLQLNEGQNSKEPVNEVGIQISQEKNTIDTHQLPSKTPKNDPHPSLKAHNISSIVWKHKSGIKGHMNKNKQKAWERRRLVLAGTKLLYYDLTGKDIAESMGAIVGGVQMSPRVSGTFNENQAFGARGMVNLLRPGSRVTPVTTFKNESESELRGPTSFGMEIIVGDIKWKFCFDRVEDQALWIKSLNDVVYRMKYLAEREMQLKKLQPNLPNRSSTVMKKENSASSLKRPPQHAFRKENDKMIMPPEEKNPEAAIWHEVAGTRAINQKDFLLRESKSRFLLGKAQLMNNSYKAAKNAFNKTLESRLILFGPNDPEVAQVYEALGDVAAAEFDSAVAQVNYKQSLDIIKKCKRKLDSIPSIVMEKGSSPFKEDLENDNSVLLDAFQKKVEEKLKDVSGTIPISNNTSNDGDDVSDESDNSKSYQNKISRLKKKLESRTEIFGTKDPEIANIFVMMGDTALKFDHDIDAEGYYSKALEILSECKAKIVSDFNESESKNNLELQPNYIRVDVASKMIVEKKKNMNKSLLEDDSDSSDEDYQKQKKNLKNQRHATEQIHKLNQEVRRKDILSKIAIGMKEQMKDELEEKDLVICSLRNQMEERARCSIGLEDEVRSLKLELSATQKLLEAREVELKSKDDTIKFLMSKLEVSKKHVSSREF